MRIAVLGTGVVGRTLGARLAGLGHDVVLGTRDVAATLQRGDPDGSFAEWQARVPGVRLADFAEAAAHGELVVNATAGMVSLAALEAAGEANLAGKVLLDVANALDFSAGFPPALAVASTDSLAEQIQRRFPAALVVKSLNTMNCQVMVDPGRLAGEHDVFVSGDDEAARGTVAGLLRQLGWPDGSILDLGPLRTARGTELYLPLWLSLLQKLGSADLNVHVVTAG